MIEKHAELVKMLKGRSLRFIVVNDASKRGFTKDAVGRLLEALPDTMIVSYDTNKEKESLLGLACLIPPHLLLYIRTMISRMRRILSAGW